ncbi:Anti-sigma-K factor RskA [Corynebacterium pseudopelargi]|uniref:Anti-sigma-K factor RskA n=2 Tax=Corynebacterium pseudopelargi TaxID=2080757 RepID=A0A3G6IVH8_9CORY|nr:Anti-sigma-K factor RskA [Corynebacterium pseudopelargi]
MLAALSAFGALPDEEARDVEKLKEPEFERMRGQFRDVAAGLSSEADMPDSDAAWRKLKADLTPQEVPSISRRRKPWFAAIAAAAALVVGAVVVVPQLGNDAEQQQSVQAEKAVEVPVAGGTVTLEYAPGSNQAKVSLHNVPAPPADQAYQMWLVDDQGAQSAGVMESEEIEPEMEAEISGVRQAKAFMITQEPAGGSTTPSQALLEVPLEA